MEDSHRFQSKDVDSIDKTPYLYNSNLIIHFLMKKSSAINRIIISAFLLFPAFILMAQKDSSGMRVLQHSVGENGVNETTIIQSLRKNEGMTDEQIQNLLEYKRSQGLWRASPEFKMWKSEANKKMINLLNAGSCDNYDMGVDSGSFANWQGQIGCNDNSGWLYCSDPWTSTSLPCTWSNTTWLSTPYTDSRIVIVPSPASDPCADVLGHPINLPAPNGGNYSIQLGNNYVGCESERLIHTMLVQPADTNFIYQYAVVLQNPPGHTAENQPFFDFVIIDQATGDTVPCSYQHYIAAPGLPGFYESDYSNFSCYANAGFATIYYKPWTVVGVNLGGFIGRTVQIICTTADCAQGGHFGYAYLDFSCGTLPNSAQYCVGTTSFMLTAPYDPTLTYSWSAGVTAIGITGDSVMVNPLITDTVILKMTPPSGCGFYLSYYLHPTIITPGFSDSTHCNMVYFKDTTKITGGTISNWNWSFPGGNPSAYSGQSPVVTYAAAGTYSASLTITSQAGCKPASVGKTITISPNAVANAGPDISICNGTTRTLCASGGTTYVWQPGGSTTSCITVKPSSSTTYTLVVANSNGCGSTALKKITVDNMPVVSASANTTICAGDSAILQANVQSGQSPYSWYWYPQNALNNPNAQNPIARPDTTTNFTVSVTDVYGCTADTNTIVYVQAIPNLTFTSWTPALTCDGYIMSLKANVSSNVQSVFWDFGDGSSITTYAPNIDPGTHSYPFNGTYNITTTTFNPPCKSTHDTTLVVSEIMKLINVLPSNVFTPNGDHNNDCFHPAICDLAAATPTTPCPQEMAMGMTDCLDLEVYDRWGIKMFKTSDSKKCWDGTTMKGNPAKEGTYYYIAKFEAITLKGFVELYR